MATNGQMSDSGWVFPTTVTTVADHLTQAQLTWKGYKEYMGNIPFRESAVCGHSTVGAGQHRHLPPDLGAADHRLSGLPAFRKDGLVQITFGEADVADTDVVLQRDAGPGFGPPRGHRARTVSATFGTHVFAGTG